MTEPVYDKSEKAIEIYNQGVVFFENKEFDKAIECWLNILRDDDIQAYTNAQLNLGNTFSEKGNIDQAIVFWNNITRDDNKQVYAIAQIFLADFFYNKNDLVQVIKYLNNVKREDSEEYYAQAQLKLGLVFNKKGNTDKAVVFWNNIQRNDDKKAYANAQFNLGFIFDKEGKSNLAIAHWNNVQKNDDKEDYAKAQYNLGIVLYVSGDVGKAIRYWLNIDENDDKTSYAKAQFNLANTFLEKGDTDQAIIYWGNVKRDGDKELYTKAQFNLGFTFYEKSILAQAINYFTHVEREGDEEAYAKAQFFIGIIHCERNEIDEAIAHWEIIQNDDAVWYNEAQFQLGKIHIHQNQKELAVQCWGNAHYEKPTSWRQYINLEYVELLTKCNDKNIVEIIQSIFLIQAEVNKIVHSVVLKPFIDKGYKKQPERKVAHYTNVGVIENLISNENTSFWLNMYNNMNDMTEGKALFDFIGLDEKKKDEDFFAFLTCFTFNHNSLNQFRLYGKIDNIEGSGVSFVVNNNMFSDKHIDDDVISFTDLFKKSISINDTNIVSKDEDNTSSPAEDNNSIAVKQKLPLYRCIYINPVNGYVSVSKRNKYSFYLENENPENEFTEYEKEIQIIEQKVKASLIEIQKKYQDIINSGIKDELKQSVDSLVEKILLLLRFLIKHASFEEEAECRILYIKSLYDEMVKCEGDRIFIPYNIPAVGRNGEETYLKKLYLGPKVKSSVEMKLKHLYHAQSKQVLNVEVSDLPLA